ncbi:hypothetical protein PAXRUDRAFT_723585 [Paxillus rubicundulus Ve08.2h10]|uniref:Uncharacterized protein n=1 Tax=Paxillus rubicundulus Ve08.2h10 TaxID=930991 RepID=A0A0D0DKJ4_9AGAM|nr:hypothetical protein PAXRUDRAFT_723585 [Paxillus rubicundulus Ve08.2h10]
MTAALTSFAPHGVRSSAQVQRKGGQAMCLIEFHLRATHNSSTACPLTFWFELDEEENPPRSGKLWARSVTLLELKKDFEKSEMQAGAGRRREAGQAQDKRRSTPYKSNATSEAKCLIRPCQRSIEGRIYHTRWHSDLTRRNNRKAQVLSPRPPPPLLHYHSSSHRVFRDLSVLLQQQHDTHYNTYLDPSHIASPNALLCQCKCWHPLLPLQLLVYSIN